MGLDSHINPDRANIVKGSHLVGRLGEPKNELYCMDAIEYLEKMNGRVDCIIADPPDRNGLKYINYTGAGDVERKEDYLEWIRKMATLALQRANMFWFSLPADAIFDFC